MKLITIAILLLSPLAFANQAERDRRILLNTEDSVNPSTEELNQYPEIYLDSDSIISERNTETGIIEDPFYTRNDDVFFSLSYQFSYDYEAPTKISAIEGSYKQRFDNSYQMLWYGVQIKRTTANYDAIAEERTSDSGDANSVANTQRDSNSQALTTIGFGLGHRFKTLSEAFNSDRFFEMIMVYGNYIFHADSTDTEQYRGYGYNADYSLLYRSSKSMTYGFKISYNWATVERPVVDEEKLPDRTLVFGWTALGFELGYFF